MLPLLENGSVQKRSKNCVEKNRKKERKKGQARIWLKRGRQFTSLFFIRSLSRSVPLFSSSLLCRTLLIYASLRAATPGSTRPSRSSREAPPPVEMWDILGPRPAASTAATESPPPMMVVVPEAVSSASFCATTFVPSAKFFHSNTPMGPFQTMSLQSESLSAISLLVSGPLSRPIQPSSISSTFATLKLASSANASASTTSEGRMNSTPFSFALASRDLASSSLSSSTREDPTLRPLAFRKVNTIPPPMMILSHFSISFSITPIFEDTFEPPTMAAKGRLGSSMAP
mmetsp:Transcript_10101/g.19545  ORF Transcript_10101/g.19545 Transcript_10101/m.19545 type:complete len:287 (+) Transcript_10101:777-1637(+)